MTPHFLQTGTWKSFKETGGSTTFLDSSEHWSYVAYLEKTPLGSYLYVPYGPTLDKKAALQPALKSLKKLAKSQGSLFVRIEPTLKIAQSDMKKLGLIKTKNQNPEHTLILNLTPTADELLNNMKQNNRNLYRNYIKKGIKIVKTQDPSKISILTRLIAGVTAHNHFHAHDEEYLKNQLASGFATLYIAELDKKPIAASLVYDTPTTRIYSQAAADYEHRKLSAGTILVVQMILDARADGKKYFDFWGITPSEDPKHPWYGFTKFKKSFGGEVVTYSGTYDLPVQKVKYRLYGLIRAINLGIRRLKRP
ncbi:MAG: lipid II:glycine glycyltransferase FemX [Candidatus Saccharimonadales bacterium]